MERREEMTDYYKILDVERDASKEEIKKAYEKQTEKLKKEVVNEKRLNQFLKIIDEAYDALNSIEENQSINENRTLIMNPPEDQKELEDNNSINYTDRSYSKSKGRSSSRKKNGFTGKVVSQDKDKKSKDKKSKINENKEEQLTKRKVTEKRSKSDTKSILKLIKLPFKILALPIIAVLSIIIALLQIINIISWIATKLLIVGSISAGAIHLYQVKMGQTMNYNILILAVSVLLASFFLPYILEFVLKVLKTLNDTLKSFVF